jgi:YYY domain-containing protein
MKEKQIHRTHAWLYDLALVAILLVGTYFRVIGLNWDEDQHLHPDERFLTMVETGLQVKKCAEPSTPVEVCPPEQKRWLSFSDYFNTATSPLNPHNRGYGFFVYGTLPIFAVRYAAEWLNQTGYDQVHLVGRQLSAAADLGTIVLLYIIVTRLYGRRAALLAAAFSALAVLQIQQSHFFTTDTFTNFFMFLAIYFAVEIAIGRWIHKKVNPSTDDTKSTEVASPDKPSIKHHALYFIQDPLTLLSMAFGFALGMAVACKINAAVLAVMLPGAFFIRAFSARSNQSSVTSQQSRGSIGHWPLFTNNLSFERILLYLVVGAFTAILAFRIFQPYAFNGPGFFGLKPNPAWIANIREQRGQASGEVDLPFALQWARRSHLFSFINLTVWGLGLPLGILAWVGFLWMGWRILMGEWRSHALLWAWTAFYFFWQSLQFNPTMRYQLPIYPLLAMMAAWAIIQSWEVRGQTDEDGKSSFIQHPASFWRKALALLLGGSVFLATLGWAYAFTRIYTRPATRVAATRWIYQNVPAPINLRIQTPDGKVYQEPLPFPTGESLQEANPYLTSFTTHATGNLTGVYFPHVAALSVASMQASTPIVSLNPNAPSATQAGGENYEAVVPDSHPTVVQTLSLSLTLQPDTSKEQALATATLTSDFPARPDLRGSEYTLTLNRSIPVTQGQIYFLRLEATGALALAGAAPANESTWDDGLPLRMDGYDGFSGLYRGDLNFEMYWDDNADKLTRFTSTLDQADYIFISSNRQWATITRVPERYPLSTTYYRELIGCPLEKEIIWCYNVAKPGDFRGNLGYELVTVFESYPTLGMLSFNDQFAEEAFTVYDHPKVLIFQRRPDYDPAHVQAVLGAVDLSRVVHLTPRQAGKYKDLMLPANRLNAQQAGGTWSELFNYQSLQNRYPLIGLLLWYVFITVLGLVTYPILRATLPGLADRGYPLARSMGMVLLAYFPWLLGSLKVPYSRMTIGLTFALITLIGGVIAYHQRRELQQEIRERGKYFLLIEGLFLAFFLIDLFIRIGNPDLWHPAKGGERPMNFSYFNATLKSTTFPPYDPWFAGGYINYYYYGYVIVGTPVKLLGIVPSIAYNMILPTLFAMLAAGGFSLGYNLIEVNKGKGKGDKSVTFNRPSLLSGFAAAIGITLLGNLGTIRMLYQGFQRMAAPGGIIDSANIFQRWIWAAQGIVKTLGGAILPFGQGDWYWFPSRVIPAPGDVEPITEFPFFTFLYSDLHAHMIALPLALLALSWVLSIVLGRAKWGNAGITVLSFLLGGLAIGALYPTNLSDIYTYLPLGFTALGYAIWRYADLARTHWLPALPSIAKRLILIILSVLALTALSFWLYEPYRLWYGQAYSAIDPWKGSHTPIWSYLTHWGLFLFVIASWMAWETREWMATTPVSALSKLKPFLLLIEIGAAYLLIALLALAFFGVQVSWIVIPLAAWAGVLILRPGMADAKRLVLFWVGTGLLITLLVELVVVRGDIGRMNTVFKFYLQAWTLFAVCAAAAFAWLLPEISKWTHSWRSAWETIGVLLLAGAALFTFSATLDKIRDRIAVNAPHSLDSMAYMDYARYWDSRDMDLNQDYHAIRWMQDHIQGSPVIVEGNTPEYRWGTRYTIYTGLPGVVGWNWHQRQQRNAIPPNWITDRIDEIANFYNTTDSSTARSFLKKYNVRYIVLGQLEHIYYPGAGLEKFSKYNEIYWTEVFRYGDTAIYEVSP